MYVLKIFNNNIFYIIVNFEVIENLNYEVLIF